MRPRPAGTWASPVTAESLVAGAVGVADVVPDGDDVWWSEQRLQEQGRTALVRWRNGVTTEATPETANVRTSVHEYGGGAWWVDRGVASYVGFDDQRLRFDGEGHGFRRAENLVRAIEAELWFYGHVLGFEPADEIESVEILTDST